MITGDLKSKIDAVWNDFWSGGISNPLEVMEQLTYLLFVKALDERQTLAANKANRTGQPIDDVIFPEGEQFKPEGLVAKAGPTPTCAGHASRTWRLPTCTKWSRGTCSRSCSSGPRRVLTPST